MRVSFRAWLCYQSGRSDGAAQALVAGWRSIQRDGKLWHACPRHYEVRSVPGMPRIWQLVQEDKE